MAATHSFSFWLLKSFWKPQSTEYHFPDVTDKIVCVAKLIHLEACTFPGMSGEASCINKITPTYNAWLLFFPYKWNPGKSIFLHRIYSPILYFIIRNYSEVHVISYIDLDRNIFLIAAEMVNIFNECFCFKVIVIHLLFTESYPSIREMQKLLRISPHASCLFTSLIASSAFSHVLLPSCT